MVETLISVLFMILLFLIFLASFLASDFIFSDFHFVVFQFCAGIGPHFYCCRLTGSLHARHPYHPAQGHLFFGWQRKTER